MKDIGIDINIDIDIIRVDITHTISSYINTKQFSPIRNLFPPSFSCITTSKNPSHISVNRQLIPPDPIQENQHNTLSQQIIHPPISPPNFQTAKPVIEIRVLRHCTQIRLSMRLHSWRLAPHIQLKTRQFISFIFALQLRSECLFGLTSQKHDLACGLL